MSSISELTPLLGGIGSKFRMLSKELHSIGENTQKEFSTDPVKSAEKNSRG